MWDIREEERCIQRFGWELEGRRPLIKRQHRWKNNIKIDLPDIVLEALTVINWAQNRSSG